MFTGIVQAVGVVSSIEPAGASASLEVDCAGLDLSDVAVGDSVAVNGVCLTVTAVTGRALHFDVSHETLAVAAGLYARQRVNLEKSLRLADRLGGHLVNGHVDGVGEVASARQVGGNREIEVRFPQTLARYIARKGSVALDGVSLTVNAVQGDCFTVNLIPHTLAATNLGDLAPGAKVNLEADMVARYVERMLVEGGAVNERTDQ
jgi:riboflavin synthase